MPLTPIPLSSGSYQDRSLPVSAQRLVNMYIDVKPAGSKTQAALHGTPGLKLWGTAGTGPIRGLKRMGGLLYVVSGGEVYRVNSAALATLAGSITGSAPVDMQGNGNDMFIASDNDAYLTTSTSHGLLRDTSSNPITAVGGVTFQDGYLLYAKRSAQNFFVSGINVATFNPIDFDLANADPDNNITLRNANREVWVFGERSTEIHYNSGAVFPFTRNPAGVVQIGCLSARSVTDIQGVLFWLGDDRKVYHSSGVSGVPISTNPMEKDIDGYLAPESAVGFVYGQEGHIFYCLKFGEATWCYDLGLKQWHERVSEGRSNWRVSTHQFMFGKNLVGDDTNGNIYELDLDTFDENGDVLRRIATTHMLHGGGRRVYMSRFHVDAEVGVGLESGQGLEPQLGLDWSDDGGRTYSSQHFRTAGKQGEYIHRAQWSRLGSFRNRILRVSSSDPVRTVWKGAFGEIEGASL